MASRREFFKKIGGALAAGGVAIAGVNLQSSERVEGVVPSVMPPEGSNASSGSVNNREDLLDLFETEPPSVINGYRKFNSDAFGGQGCPSTYKNYVKLRTQVIMGKRDD